MGWQQWDFSSPHFLPMGLKALPDHHSRAQHIATNSNVGKGGHSILRVWKGAWTTPQGCWLPSPWHQYKNQNKSDTR